MKILGGEGLQKFLSTRKGVLEKVVGLGGGLRKSVYFETNRTEPGGSLEIEPLARGAAKIFMERIKPIERNLKIVVH